MFFYLPIWLVERAVWAVVWGSLWATDSLAPVHARRLKRGRRRLWGILRLSLWLTDHLVRIHARLMRRRMRAFGRMCRGTDPARQTQGDIYRTRRLRRILENMEQDFRNQ